MGSRFALYLAGEAIARTNMLSVTGMTSLVEPSARLLAAGYTKHEITAGDPSTPEEVFGVCHDTLDNGKPLVNLPRSPMNGDLLEDREEEKYYIITCMGIHEYWFPKQEEEEEVEDPYNIKVLPYHVWQLAFSSREAYQSAKVSLEGTNKLAQLEFDDEEWVIKLRPRTYYLNKLPSLLTRLLGWTPDV